MPIAIVTPAVSGLGDDLGSLIDEILSNLQGYTASPDQVTFLSQDVTADALTFKVDDSAGVSSGLMEIGNELIWATGFDEASANVTVLPRGRGWRGTHAAPHLAGDTVVLSPAVPRSVVTREINNQLNSLYPSLFAVGTYEFTHDDPLKIAWSVPVGVEIVLDVRYQDFLGNWQRVKAWELEYSSDAAVSTTGVSVRISNVPIGFKVQIVYGTRPPVFSDETSSLSSAGLSPGVKDLLVFGCMARIMPMLDVARLSVQHVAADELATPRPLGSASALADKFWKQYQQRLAEERRILNDRYPARIHWTR